MTQSPLDDSGSDARSAGSVDPVGDGEYIVQQGECLASIAYERGFVWQTLWNHPGNAKLKAGRQDPKVLLPGDRVHIPPPRVQVKSCATDKRHRFVRKGVPEFLRIVLLDSDGKPRANLPYTLMIEGKHESGMSDGAGMIEFRIPPNARDGELIVGKEAGAQHYRLNLGSIDPPSTITGVQSRLNNLGFPCGEVNGDLAEQTVQALKEFQERYALPVTGAIDDKTRGALVREHGF
jgi:N-acetylmuramoyl-L-alanine amidase